MRTVPCLGSCPHEPEFNKIKMVREDTNQGKWNLCTSPVDYPHPSAKFYMEGFHASCPVTNFMEMDVVVFVTQDIKGLDYEKGDKYG